MKICFITQNGHEGKLPRNFDNCRVEFAWQIALDAYHVPINDILNKDPYDKFHLGIVILPKKLENFSIPYFQEKLKPWCSKLCAMQEGPSWYFQDYNYENQVNYLNFVKDMDFILTHNQSDIPYFKGIFKKPTFNLQSLIIEDTVVPRKTEKTNLPIIGGNFCSWYSGLDSYFVAKNFSNEVYVPSMGRRIKHEEHFPGLNHLPYMKWKEWMNTLSKFDYGVHLMRTHAAGTFALNCSFYGIPCIGYKGLDTQEVLHPELSINLGDIEKANELAIKLRDDKGFYNYCSSQTKAMYGMFYKEKEWLKNWAKIYEQI